MTVMAEANLLARARLLDQIDLLAAGVNRVSATAFVHQVDEIRCAAQQSRYPHIAELARGLERTLADSASTVRTLAYIDAMRDALECAQAEPHMAQAFLASINQRLYG